MKPSYIDSSVSSDHPSEVAKLKLFLPMRCVRCANTCQGLKMVTEFELKLSFWRLFAYGGGERACARSAMAAVRWLRCTDAARSWLALVGVM